MGAAGSVGTLEEKLDISTVKRLAGDQFNQEKFDAHKDADGYVSKETFMTLAGATFNLAQAPVAEPEGTPMDGMTAEKADAAAAKTAALVAAAGTMTPKDGGGGRLPSVSIYQSQDKFTGALKSDEAKEYLMKNARKSTLMAMKECAAESAVDAEEPQVEEAMDRLESSASLGSTGSLVRTFSMSEDARSSLYTERREMLQKDAKAAQERFAQLSEEEQKRPQNQMNIALYSYENQAIIESLFTHPEIEAQLDIWWKHAKLYFDGNDNDVLEKDEYAAFYKRLLNLLDGASELSEEEANVAFEDDWVLFSEGDGKLTREEFRYGVFKLADHWTCTTFRFEYVDFLQTSFKTVFGDLIVNDALLPPESWVKALDVKKKYSSLPELLVIEEITQLYRMKSEEDRGKTAAERSFLDKFVIEEFKKRFGGEEEFKKRFKAFVTGVCAIVDDPNSAAQDYAILFAQMCGMYTESKRQKPFPPKVANFVLEHMLKILPVAEQTDEDYGYREHAGIFKRGEITNKKVKAMVAGYAEVSGAKKVLLKTLEEAPAFRGHPKLANMATASLDALSLLETREWLGEVEEHRVVPCIKFVVLLGELASAWNLY